MRIAVLGSGISGLTAAYRLQERHEVSLFEAAPRLGGHTHTVDVQEDGRTIPVDTGFIVFNEQNYPEFTRLLSEWGVGSRSSNMSFSVRDERNGLEYRSSSLDTLFAQRANLLRPSFHRMIRDLVRFYREAPAVLSGDGSGLSVGEYLRGRGYGTLFVEDHIVPMASALWSTDAARIDAMPVEYLVRFMDHHRMLDFRGRPEWLVVRGGSREYVRAWSRVFRGTVHLATPVEAVRRAASGPEIRTAGADWMGFDAVVIAVHSDQALRLLADPTAHERRVLGAIRYRANDVALHTDARFLPRRRRAWSSWNYHVVDPPRDAPTVTYFMNRLQGLDTREPYLVTLNRTSEIEPSRLLRRFTYHHPVFDGPAVAAQKEFHLVNGHRGTYYCGAYWGFGFHEDGVRSALAAIRPLLEEASPCPE